MHLNLSIETHRTNNHRPFFPAQVGSFSTAMHRDGVTFISPSPKPFLSFNSLFNPLDVEVWASLFAAYVVATLLIYLTTNLVSLWEIVL